MNQHTLRGVIPACGVALCFLAFAPSLQAEGPADPPGKEVSSANGPMSYGPVTSRFLDVSAPTVGLAPASAPMNAGGTASDDPPLGSEVGNAGIAFSWWMAAVPVAGWAGYAVLHRSSGSAITSPVIDNNPPVTPGAQETPETTPPSTAGTSPTGSNPPSTPNAPPTTAGPSPNTSNPVNNPPAPPENSTPQGSGPPSFVSEPPSFVPGPPTDPGNGNPRVDPSDFAPGLQNNPGAPGTVTPEPASLLLMTSGLLGLAAARKRKRAA